VEIFIQMVNSEEQNQLRGPWFDPHAKGKRYAKGHHSPADWR
jgi:hypothetical protein